MLEDIYKHLTIIALKKYRDFIREVTRVKTPSGITIKIRVIFIDNSFLDVYWSSSGKYSLHYERRHIDGTIYRHDNAPHENIDVLGRSRNTSIEVVRIGLRKASYLKTRQKL